MVIDMKSVNVVLAMFLIVCISGEMSALSKNLCMSDDELRAYLHEGVMFQLGYGGATCCRREASPDLACQKVVQELQRFEKTSESYLRINRDRAFAPFRRSFGAQAETMFKSSSDRMEAHLREVVRKFDQRQCSNWLAAIEGYSHLDQKSLGEVVTSRLVTPTEFAAERQRIPRC